MVKRSSLSILLLIALVTWLLLLLFTHLIAPRNILAFIVFFLILSVALTSTLAPVAYATGQFFLAARQRRVTLRQAVRQGALFAFVIVLNLILRALHSWSITMALVILAAAVVIEILALARK